MNWPLLQNSLLVSASATALALLAGFVCALWALGLSASWRKIVAVLAVVALALPPFVVTNCWLHLLGNGGVWRGWLPFNIFSLGGTVWLLALLHWPIAFFLTLAAWQRLDKTLIETAPELRGIQFIRWLLWPMARGQLGLAAAIIFVLTLNHFAIPAIMQTKVYPAEMWVSFNTTFNYTEALRLSLPLIVAPLLLLWVVRCRQVRWPSLSASTESNLLWRQLGGLSVAMCLMGVLLVVLSVGLPVYMLAAIKRTWVEFPGALAAGQSALWNSATSATLVATLVVMLALGFACGKRLGSKTQPQSGTQVMPAAAGAMHTAALRSFLWLPFLLPGVLLGMALIYILNRQPFVAFYQSSGVVLLALTIRYLAPGWNTAAQAVQSVDRDLLDATLLAGASRWQQFRHALWPQVGGSLAAAWYVTYLLCLWDVETLVLIIPPGGETLAMRVFNLLHYGHNSQVNALCLMLLALAVLPLALYWTAASLTARRSRAGLYLALMMIVVGLSSGCVPEIPTSQTILQNRFFSHVEIIGARGTGPGQFNKPRSLAVDRQDNLYVADMTGRVQKFSPSGEFLLSWQMPQTDLGKPKGMACDADGNIVVIEPHYQRVNHFSPEGKLISQWGVTGTNAGQLTLPRAVAVTSKGDLFVSEYTVVDRVQGFSRKEQLPVVCFGTPGTAKCEFNRAEGLGIDTKDQIYVADSCNHRIQVFSTDGKWLRTYGAAGPGNGQLSYPYDVRVDAEGFQYVCEFGNSRIQIFDEHDRPVGIIGGAGAAPGQFANPWSIAFDSKGNLYVADSQNHRVQKLIRRKES